MPSPRLGLGDDVMPREEGTRRLISHTMKLSGGGVTPEQVEGGETDGFPCGRGWGVHIGQACVTRASLGAKGGNTQGFSSACPDVGQHREVVALKLVTCLTSVMVSKSIMRMKDLNTSIFINYKVFDL